MLRQAVRAVIDGDYPIATKTLAAIEVALLDMVEVVTSAHREVKRMREKQGDMRQLPLWEEQEAA